MTLARAYSPTLGRWLSRDPLGESAGANLYGYAANSPINLIDPLGLRVYTEQETKKLFLDPAEDAATQDPVTSIGNILDNSLGKYDFGQDSTMKNDFFTVNGGQMNADEFGNFIAGFQGNAYDYAFWGVPFSALSAIQGGGLFFHMTGMTKAKDDWFDETGMPFINAGALYFVTRKFQRPAPRPVPCNGD